MENKFPDDEKRELGIQMMQFCEYMWEDFQYYYKQETGETVNEQLFEEMLLNLEDVEIDNK